MIRALWRDGVAYAAGTVLARGVGLLALPLVMRVLTPSEFGVLELIVTLGLLVNLVVPLETSQALARFWNERTEGAPRRRLAGTAWGFTLAGHTVFVVLCVLAAPLIAQTLLGDALYTAAVRAGVCAIALNNIFYLLQNQFRWELRAWAYAVASVGYALTNLLLMAGFAWGLGAGLEGVLWAQAVAAACASALSFAVLRHSFTFGIARDELAAMLRFSLPLVPAGIALFASFYVNRLMLNALGTLDDVGVFGIASRLAGLATLVLIAAQGALTPLVYAHHNQPETPARLVQLFNAFCAVALSSCLALGLFASELVTLLATPAYSGATHLLIWLAAAAILQQMYVFMPGIGIAKKTHWQLAITLASALAAVALNALLIPRWGVWGATVATLFTGAMFFGTWLAAGQKLYPLPLRLRPLAAALGLFVLLGIATPLLDAGDIPLVLRMLSKLAVLLGFVVALRALGLLPLREWQRALAAAI